MKILLVNKYFFRKGGAESYFIALRDMLIKNGHQAIVFAMKHKNNMPSDLEKHFVRYWDNENHSFRNVASASMQMVYSYEARLKIRKIIDLVKPDIVHLNNIYHQISPSIIHEIKRFKIPMVMTVHDLKLVCPAYSMFSQGKVCVSCEGGKYYYCTKKRCVKGSYPKSLLATFEMYFHHKFLNIYKLIDLFIAPSKFVGEKISTNGFRKKIIYLPNFININKYKPNYKWTKKTIVYFGRLEKNKGVLSLVNAVKNMCDVKLEIIGDGSLKELLKSKVKTEHIKNVEIVGFLSQERLFKRIQNVMFTIVPSELYENNPLSVIESFALGKPVIGARIGGIPEMVIDNKTGACFTPGDAEDLRKRIRRLMESPDDIVKYGRNARKFVEENLSEENYYNNLIDIYEKLGMNRHDFESEKTHINQLGNSLQ